MYNVSQLESSHDKLHAWMFDVTYCLPLVGNSTRLEQPASSSFSSGLELAALVAKGEQNLKHSHILHTFISRDMPVCYLLKAKTCK